MRLPVFCLLALCAAARPSHANLLVNGSFEAPAITSGALISITGGGTSSQNGWDWNYITGVQSGTAAGGFNGAFQPASFDGSQYAYLQGTSSSVSQSFTLSYDAVVSISWITAGRGDSSPGGFDGNTNYSVMAGDLTFNGSTTTGSNFTANGISGELAAGTYTLVIGNTSGAGDHTLFVDNVDIAVPEPATFALFAASVFGLGIMRRRRIS